MRVGLRAADDDQPTPDRQHGLELVSSNESPSFFSTSGVAGRIQLGAIRELHRDPEAILVLRADLRQELERMDAGNRREPLRRLEEVALGVGAGRMREGENNGVPDALPVHSRSL